jgi:ribosomal protein S18 acetylase RimI-like enzyme
VTTAEGIVVEAVRPGTEACELALRHADLNRSTLGFFPAEAFREQVERGRVLVATANGEFAGYLMYRVARGRASVVHLCTAADYRRRGVAKRLVEELRRRVSQLLHIEARCRNDFDAHAAWKALGFTAVAEVPGRGRERRPITVFQYNLGHADLFSGTPSSDALCCALDASVIIGMQDGRDDCPTLLADWIGDEVEYVVTAELANDLHEAADEALRRRRLQFASQFPELRHDPDDYEAKVKLARRILPEGSGPDSRHVARASAAGADVFLTTDIGILSRAVEILDELDLRVLHPSDFVRRLDALQSAEKYAPVRLAGTRLELRSLRAEDLDLVSSTLRYGGGGERDGAFRSLVRRGFQARQDADVLWISSGEGDPLGMLVGLKLEGGPVYEITAVRVPAGRASHAAQSRVLARHLAYLALERAGARGCSIVRVTDVHLHPVMHDGLKAEGFVSSEGTYVRIVLSGMLGQTQFASALALLAERHATIVDACTGGIAYLLGRLGQNEPDAYLAVADRLGTVKVLPLPLPCYVIPIQPRWAEHLFDTGLAGQGLFGADMRLGLAREAVYYRSTRGPAIPAPALVLWYVSQSTGAIRACSLVRQVEAGEAHDLYRRNWRLGVWRWGDVLRAARNNPQGEIMALTFTNTELFPTPIPYAEVQRILETTSTFPGPLPISSEGFLRLYGAGIASQ